MDFFQCHLYNTSFQPKIGDRYLIDGTQVCIHALDEKGAGNKASNIISFSSEKKALPHKLGKSAKYRKGVQVLKSQK